MKNLVVVLRQHKQSSGSPRRDQRRSPVPAARRHRRRPPAHLVRRRRGGAQLRPAASTPRPAAGARTVAAAARESVIDAYFFLAEHWEPEDRIFLLGGGTRRVLRAGAGQDARHRRDDGRPRRPRRGVRAGRLRAARPAPHDAGLEADPPAGVCAGGPRRCRRAGALPRPVGHRESAWRRRDFPKRTGWATSSRGGTRSPSTADPGRSANAESGATTTPSRKSGSAAHTATSSAARTRTGRWPTSRSTGCSTVWSRRARSSRDEGLPRTPAPTELDALAEGARSLRFRKVPEDALVHASVEVYRARASRLLAPAAVAHRLVRSGLGRTRRATAGARHHARRRRRSRDSDELAAVAS